jgi:hypothetical protein
MNDSNQIESEAERYAVQIEEEKQAVREKADSVQRALLNDDVEVSAETVESLAASLDELECLVRQLEL